MDADQSEWNFAQLYPKDVGRFGEFLKRSGRPLRCRLDIRVTSMEELRWACVLISKLNKDLQAIAFEDERDEVLRVILARGVLETARISLKYLKPNVPKVAAKKARAGRRPTTTGSVATSPGVGNLDRGWKRPTLPRRTEGENE